MLARTKKAERKYYATRRLKVSGCLTVALIDCLAVPSWAARPSPRLLFLELGDPTH